MTDRLYYGDAYRTAFDAVVQECREAGGKALVRLDRSAFYPTSGGQPYDTGALNGARVSDVFVDGAGEVWHEVDSPLAPGEIVLGQIDWARRFDHMQQHSGEHMLAGAIYRQLRGHVIGLHLGAEVSTIDVELPGGGTRISDEAIRSLELDVNEKIQTDVPVVCSFPDADALRAMPLRKPPTVERNVRVVAIGDFECVACGGTHVRSTGQIGLLKVVDARPSKGKMRVSFVAGMRAYRDYQRQYDLAGAAARLFSTSVDRLPDAVAAVQGQLRDASRALTALRREKLFSEIPEMLRGARALSSGARLVIKKFEADAQLLRELAGKLIAEGNVAALLAADAGGSNLFVFARSQDVDIDMGKLLSSSARARGGKGGGRPDFAEGGGPDAVLFEAEKALTE